jgi:DNA-binding LacI/PurR family transcriptional regulator
MVELGRRAVRALGKEIEANRNGALLSPKTVLLRPELIIRESSLLAER